MEHTWQASAISLQEIGRFHLLAIVHMVFVPASCKHYGSQAATSLGGAWFTHLTHANVSALSFPGLTTSRCPVTCITDMSCSCPKFHRSCHMAWLQGSDIIIFSLSLHPGHSTGFLLLLLPPLSPFCPIHCLSSPIPSGTCIRFLQIETPTVFLFPG